MFKPSKIRSYLQRLPEIGMTPEDVLSGSGISWADIDALKPLDLSVTAGLFDRLAETAPRNFAVYCGRKTRVRDFGIVGYAMMSSGTLRGALERWNRYCLVAGHPLMSETVEQGERWKFVYVPRVQMTVAALHFCIEASLSGLENVIEELTGTPANTNRIDFSYSAEKSLSQLQPFGDTPMYFGQAATAYHGNRADLDRPVLAGDSDVQELCERQCAHQLASILNQRRLDDRIKEMFMGCLGKIPTLEEAAEQLNLSKRTLQRELQRDGLTYKDVVESFRKGYAVTLLREGVLDVKNIAFLLGYQDTGSFRRAFHIWTCMTVRDWLSKTTSVRVNDEPDFAPHVFTIPPRVANIAEALG